MFTIAGGIIIAVLVLAFWPYILLAGACIVGVAALVVWASASPGTFWGVAGLVAICVVWHLWDEHRGASHAAQTWHVEDDS